MELGRPHELRAEPTRCHRKTVPTQSAWGCRGEKRQHPVCFFLHTRRGWGMTGVVVGRSGESPDGYTPISLAASFRSRRLCCSCRDDILALIVEVTHFFLRHFSAPKKKKKKKRRRELILKDKMQHSYPVEAPHRNGTVLIATVRFPRLMSITVCFSSLPKAFIML